MSGSTGTSRFWPAEGVHYWARPESDGWPLPLGAIAENAEGAPLGDLQALIGLLQRLSARITELDA